MTTNAKIDFKNIDYRSFIFVFHEYHGLMLLHCTRKKTKPPHWQLPGGHIDDFEFIEAAKESDDYQTQLELATKRGAARELFEETGIDIRNQLERLRLAVLRHPNTLDKSNGPILVNEHKHRLFYVLLVTDDDFATEGVRSMESIDLKLKLSEEHQGYTFQSEHMKAAELLEMHSGGKVSEALRMLMSHSPLIFSRLGDNTALEL